MSVIPPTKNAALVVDDFISYATLHLSTISGVINTVSLYPPLGTPGPGIINWTGYMVTPAKPGGAGDFNSEEAAVIERDINVEYPASQAAYEAQFASEEDAMANNSQITQEEALNSVKDYNAEVNQLGDDGVILGEDPPLSESGSLNFGNGTTSGVAGTSGGSNGPDKPKPQLIGKGDEALFKKCGNGVWPAKGSPGSFEVQSSENTGARCSNPTRYWYKVNNEYLTKNCTEIIFPTKKGGSKIMVHKNLAAIIKPALEKIKGDGLQKYIENCAGGLAVRNVTCGTRFSNHAWGTAIDMNTSVYPYGYNFKADGIYNGNTKVRDLNEFDKGFQQVAAIFKSQGMTWLSNNDPMHVSIYE
jgi:hypothetical protein